MTNTTEPTKEKPVEGVVESDDSDDDSDDDMPELEPAQAGAKLEEAAKAAAAGGSDASNKQSRGEKKSRKAIQKLGMKPVPGFTRVTIRKSKTVLFVISQPEVYKGASDTFIIFGEAKIEDMTGAKQAMAAENLGKEEAKAPVSAADSAAPKSVVIDDAADGDVDETGLNADDIELVMKQAQSSRPKAVKALKENNNDVVNAIMALSG
eukprot:c23129_g1_i1.p1 GENE.c23129_g1_i1~~c23129_g1_i1.p1  ORF type:complete len:208 (+),score=69.99 c23129_g1_i1:74-697(+)